MNKHDDAETRDYHDRQWKEPYRQTIAFAEFIRPFMKDTSVVADLGSGGGAATHYLAKQFRNESIFNAYDIKEKPPTIRYADMFNLQNIDANAVISLQTLHTLPEYETPLDQICTKIAPRWMAFSTLAYDGEISCKIEVTEHVRPRQSYYNIYSIPRMINFLNTRNYSLSSIKKFYWESPDLPIPDNHDIMKSYSYDGFIFSGPLVLPWWFLAFERI